MRSMGKVPPVAAIAELKAYLRIESGDEEPLLVAVLRAATETVEAMLGVLLVEREVVEQGPVCAGRFALSAEPVRGLESVVRAGETEPLPEDAAALELLRGGAGRVTLALPEGTRVEVRYRAGMATDWAWLPEALRLAVLRAAAHFHAHRDGADDAGLPAAVSRMLSPWKRRRVR